MRDRLVRWLVGMLRPGLLVVNLDYYEQAVKELTRATQLTGHTRRDRKFEQAIARVGGFLIQARRDPFGSATKVE